MSLGFTDTDTLTKPELDNSDNDDSDGFAHYAPKAGMVEAMIYGTPIVALCGRRFVPRRDPQKFPVCPRCKEIHEMLPPGGDE
jgi:hypothetical protein